MRAWVVALALCACGEVSKLPDASVPDAPEPDAPPTVTCSGAETVCNGGCVDTTTSELYCGNCTTQCGAYDLCKAGACKAAESCTEVREAVPSAGDGLYGAPGKAFFCDFTAKVMYSEFGFGQFNTTYPGHVLISSADLNSAPMQRAFIALVNHQGGLVNLQPGWTSNNCCFKAADSGAQWLTLAAHHLYPAKIGVDMTECGGPYNDMRYRWFEAESGPYAPNPPLPTTYFSGRAAGIGGTCGDGNNPGIFVKKTTF